MVYKFSLQYSVLFVSINISFRLTYVWNVLSGPKVRRECFYDKLWRYACLNKFFPPDHNAMYALNSSMN